MRPFAIGTTILLAATSALAAPFNSTTTHFLAKRDNVCAFDFRQGFDRTQCIGKGVKYTLTPPSAMNRVALAANEQSNGPADGQCDHLVEIQLLSYVAQESGICAILTALKDLQKYATTANIPSTADLLSQAHADISAARNLNFLQDTVNGKKKDVVQRSFKNAAQQSGPLDKAVGNFLQLVRGDGDIVAARLDTDLTTIKTRAQTALAGVADGTGRRDPIKSRKQTLSKAIEDFEKSGVNVVNAWQNLLRVAPHT